MIQNPNINDIIWVIRSGIAKHDPIQAKIIHVSLRKKRVECDNCGFEFNYDELYTTEQEAMLARLEYKKAIIKEINDKYDSELTRAYEDWALYLQSYKTKYETI